MSSPKESNSETIIARGRLFELVGLPQPDGRVFELARRAPGVRVIIPDYKAGRVLLTKEFRRELNGWDYRLPGGKVFDTLEEYDAFRKSGRDILEPAAAKAKAEASEEAGIDVKAIKFFKHSALGATVEWDLFVFEATNWADHPKGQQLEVSEQIETGIWVTFAEAETMILESQMQEERVALILLQWLNQQANQ